MGATHTRAFCDTSASGYIYNDRSASKFAKVPPFLYGENILVNKDGSITIYPNARSPEVVAFVLGCIRRDPAIPQSTQEHLARFLDDMDALTPSTAMSDDEIVYERVGALNRVRGVARAGSLHHYRPVPSDPASHP
jgi:hypothetical protein